jgi:UDP-N-acetylglucosamine 2-epimerase (non-hydrolysing)
MVETLAMVADRLPLLFPVHPRTMNRLSESGLLEVAQAKMTLLPAVGYLEMLGLMNGATLVLTDSGGIQEETTALGIPCLTLRENTERPITVEMGTNTVVGRSRPVILDAVAQILEHGGKRGRKPDKWDGRAAQRICASVTEWLKDKE